MPESDPNRKHVVYVITETSTQRVYIGKTSQDPERRWKQHKYISQEDRYAWMRDTIHELMREHGLGGYTFRVLREFDSEESSLEFEGNLIRRFKEHPEVSVRQKCLNTGLGKGRRTGYQHTEETKRKMRETRARNFKLKLAEAYQRVNASTDG